MYFYLISDRFKILKHSKKSTSHKIDHCLAASLPAAALVHAPTLSQSPELSLKQFENLQTTESEGEGRNWFHCELASFSGLVQLSRVNGKSLKIMLTEITCVSM